MAEKVPFPNREDTGSSSGLSMDGDNATSINTQLAECSNLVTSSSKDDFPGKQLEESTVGASNLEESIDRLLKKQKHELMFELRRLQHGDRPVTGQGHKEAVEQFFHRATGAEGSTSAPEETRPEHVVVEVNALVERRPVSTVLQSNRFRRNLENALRGALSNISHQPVVRSRHPAFSTQAAEESVDSATAQNVHSVRSETSSPVPTPRETLQSALEQRRRRVQGQPVPAPRRGRQSPQQPSVEPHSDNTEAGSETVQPANGSGNAFAQEWLLRQEQNNFNAGSPVHVWDTIAQVQREDLIADISELVHRQLVTSTLEGNFRNTLERRMQEVLGNSNTDGERVRDFVRSIPRTRVHVRNDFSEMGIQEQWQEALSDEMSVVSAAAAVTVPYAQSNAVLSREIKSLKAQLQEMKNMMKLQFDLSMDIQRSIRQEVAAAMNQNQGVQIQPTVSSRPVKDTHCLICLDKMVDTVLYQCGHMCVCYGCGMHLRQRDSNCPVCRAPIKDIIRAFKCNSE